MHDLTSTSKWAILATRPEQPDNFAVYESIAWYWQPFVGNEKHKQGSKFDEKQINNVLEREGRKWWLTGSEKSVLVATTRHLMLDTSLSLRSSFFSKILYSSFKILTLYTNFSTNQFICIKTWEI